MTKERLSKYGSIKTEIAVLKHEIDKMLSTNDGIESDTVLNYTSGHGIPMKITGFNQKLYDLRRSQLANREKELKIIESEFDEIEDPVVRNVLKWKYVDGMTWTNVSRKLREESGKYFSGDYIRNVLIKNYFNKIQ